MKENQNRQEFQMRQDNNIIQNQNPSRIRESSIITNQTEKNIKELKTRLKL